MNPSKIQLCSFLQEKTINAKEELERNVPSNTNTHLLSEESNPKLVLHGATSLQGELIY